MSPVKAPNKWPVGAPMIEWCERNGLDATRIPDRPDAIVTEAREGQLWARVWHVVSEDDLPWPLGPDVLSAHRRDDQVEYLRAVPVDSHPPLNPEWAALFPDAARAIQEA